MLYTHCVLFVPCLNNIHIIIPKREKRMTLALTPFQGVWTVALPHYDEQKGGEKRVICIIQKDR
jgi:hypothetical protein